MPAWLRDALLNTLVLLASVAVFYLISELVFFRIALPLIPFNARPHLPEVPEVLLQSTKKGYTPHDYIALLGDSYAEGLGDWLIQTNGNRGLPFHSANIIHEKTGRDVVSFGKAPSGSAQGLVLRPAAIFTISSCYLFPSIEEPSRIVYYFFEGNDLEDNLQTLGAVKGAQGNTDAASISKFLKDATDSQSPWRCHRHFADMLVRVAKFGYQVYVEKKRFVPPVPERTVRLHIAEKTVRSSALVGPSLGLDEAELVAGLSVFEPALAWLRARFPNVPVTVVYLPSPLYVYVPALPAAIKYLHSEQGNPNQKLGLVVEDPSGETSMSRQIADETVRRSDFICDRIRTVSIGNGADFLDSRPGLRRAASVGPIHGPVDWSHFNEKGYRALADIVLERITSGPGSTQCGEGNARLP